GGLFPRTALVLQRLLPDAQLVVIDASSENLQTAETLLARDIQRVHAFYDPAHHNGFDLVILPLAYVGDRTEFYRRPAAPFMLIHDWIWRPRGRSTIISWLLLKRVNLITASPRNAEFGGTMPPFVPILNTTCSIAVVSGGG